MKVKLSLRDRPVRSRAMKRWLKKVEDYMNTPERIAEREKQAFELFAYGHTTINLTPEQMNQHFKLGDV